MSRYAASIRDIPMPANIAKLPMDEIRGFPVPWFVSWINGKPEFRIADGRKMNRAILESRCWVCGEVLNNRVTFTIGPMCTINRVSSEPPSHPECAIYSVKACPFLTRPDMARRESNMPEGTTCAGEMIRRNPGVSCLWTTKRPGAVIENVQNGYLWRIIDPTSVTWWAHGRDALPEEVAHSIATGLPLLRDMAAADGPLALERLGTQYEEAARYWPCISP